MAKRPRKRMDDPTNWGASGRRREPADADAQVEAPPAHDGATVPAGRDDVPPGQPSAAATGVPADDTFEGWLEQVPRGFAVPSAADGAPSQDDASSGGDASAGYDATRAEHAPGWYDATPSPALRPPAASWREEVPEGFTVPSATEPGRTVAAAGRGDAAGRGTGDWDEDFEWTPPRRPRPAETAAEPGSETAPGAWKDFTAGDLRAEADRPLRDGAAVADGALPGLAGAAAGSVSDPSRLPLDAEGPARASGLGSDVPGRASTAGEPPAGAPGQWRRVGEPGTEVTSTGNGGGAGRPGGPRRTYRGRRRGDGPDGRRLAPAGKVLLALIIGLGLAALLNAQSLQSAAESMHVGTTRSIAMALVKPVTAVSSLLRLDRPRAAIEDALGRGAREVAGVHTRTPEPQPSGSDGGSGSDGTASPKPSAAPSAVIFTPTKDKKLALWVGGDSMAMTFGESLVAMADRTGVIETALDYHVSSGLSRPDFFNWPKRLNAEMKGFQPDVVVFASGANDGQDVQYEGKLYSYGTKEWNDLYRERVAVAMNIASGEQGRPVWWVGMPIARDPAQSEIYRNFNTIYREEAKKRPNVHYVDTYTMFGDANGDYSDYLTGISGKKELMRQGDGIHWSRAGSDLVAAEVMEQIAELYKFPFEP
jgi:hypothetical protein